MRDRFNKVLFEHLQVTKALPIDEAASGLRLSTEDIIKIAYITFTVDNYSLKGEYRYYTVFSYQNGGWAGWQDGVLTIYTSNGVVDQLWKEYGITWFFYRES